jgi:hypothetical protein
LSPHRYKIDICCINAYKIVIDANEGAIVSFKSIYGIVIVIIIDIDIIVIIIDIDIIGIIIDIDIIGIGIIIDIDIDIVIADDIDSVFPANV